MENLGLPDTGVSAARGLMPLDRSLPTMAGIAVTIQEGPRRVGTRDLRLPKHSAVMRTMTKDQVLVIAGGGGDAYCSWGGLLHIEAHRRGVSGVVVDGLVRDFTQITSTRTPVYCKGTTPLADHFLADVVSIGQPVVCAGVHVRPGDFVIGDCDGVCFVPPEFAEAVLEEALEKARQEEVRERNLWRAPVDRLQEANTDLNFKM
jgi:regulator of RNase E activity RraA